MKPTNMTKLANRIRGLCVAQGKEISSIRELLGLSRNAMDRRYHDDTIWKFHEILKIAEYLETDISFFLGN